MNFLTLHMRRFNAMKRAWWKESVVYQVYPRSFYDADGDGIGDLQGVIRKLDYLQTLGVDLIWLNPVYASPDMDNGYDISDFMAISPKFGTMRDMEQLIAEAHRRDIGIIMDLVMNHTSDQHPWFVQSRKSKDNPYRDYYIWRDAKDGREPNNWRAFFTKSAWTYDPQTEQYYLNTFSRFQPDLNWANPALRAELYRMIAWWLDKGINGFRLDAISFICKAPGLPDHPGSEPYILDLNNMMHGPEYHDYLRELNRAVLSKYDIVTVGECIDLTVESAIEVSAPEREELNMPFLFEHTDHALRNGKDLASLKETLTRWQTGLHGKAWVGLAFNNHDVPRVVSLFGDDVQHHAESAKLFGTLLLTLQGTPFIYQGEEIGMTNVAFPAIDDYRDIATMNLYHESVTERGEDPASVLARIHAISRDNARTPMQWDDSPNAGFTSGEPWIKVNPNYTTINVQHQLTDSHSIFAYYQTLIRLRKEHPVFVYGAYERLCADHPDLFCYVRILDDVRLLVILNLSTNTPMLPETLDIADRTPLLCNYSVTDLLDAAALRPYEVRIYL
jgi:oligo-1,6-glucosidase